MTLSLLSAVSSNRKGLGSLIGLIWHMANAVLLGGKMQTMETGSQEPIKGISKKWNKHLACWSEPGPKDYCGEVIEIINWVEGE